MRLPCYLASAGVSGTGAGGAGFGAATARGAAAGFGAGAPANLLAAAVRAPAGALAARAGSLFFVADFPVLTLHFSRSSSISRPL